MHLNKIFADLEGRYLIIILHLNFSVIVATDNFFVVPPSRLLGLGQLSPQYPEIRKVLKKSQKIVKKNKK